MTTTATTTAVPTALHATARVRDRVMTITLVGVLTPDSVPLLADLVDEAATKSVEQLVFDLRRLRGLSSAGVRCMLDGHQRLGRGVRFVIRGARPEVAELIRQAGFRHGVTMLDR